MPTALSREAAANRQMGGCQISVYQDMTDAERQVASFLTNLNIWWTFEQPVCVKDEKNRPRIWSPDFYLPELGLYIEVCGTERFDYSYREGIYKANRIPVIFAHLYKEGEKWSYFLIQRIKEIHGMRSGIIGKLGSMARSSGGPAKAAPAGRS